MKLEAGLSGSRNQEGFLRWGIPDKAARGIRTTVSGWPTLFRFWPHIERSPIRNNGLEGLD